MSLRKALSMKTTGSIRHARTVALFRSSRFLAPQRRLELAKNPSMAYFSSTSKAASEKVEEIRPEGWVEQIKYNPNLRARFKQSLFNWVFSFAAVILSAQSLKSSKARQKAEKKLEEAEAVSEERLKVLQSLVTDQTLEPLAERIVELSRQEISSKETNGWFGATKAKTKENSGLPKNEVSAILLDEMFRLVGETALDEAQREAFTASLNAEDEEEEMINIDPEKLLVAANKDHGAAKGQTGERKKAFSM